tara:strand:- start:248 stop:406 length:159 start_codon:yes stop_codon:yes gene_type:complete
MVTGVVEVVRLETPLNLRLIDKHDVPQTAFKKEMMSDGLSHVVLAKRIRREI